MIELEGFLMRKSTAALAALALGATLAIGATKPSMALAASVGYGAGDYSVIFVGGGGQGGGDGGQCFYCRDGHDFGDGLGGGGFGGAGLAPTSPPVSRRQARGSADGPRSQWFRGKLPWKIWRIP